MDWARARANLVKARARARAEFEAELAALGLKIVPVAADGNCFFRAIADQLDGDEEEHEKYREMVVLYIMEHREDFEPFVEDDMNFEKYMESMKENGTWAGHMEIQAASLVTRTNICIHTLRSPRVHIRNFDTADTRTLHLSYHDGMHYNSLIQDGPSQDLPHSSFNVDCQWYANDTEKSIFRDFTAQYECQTSEVISENVNEWIETEECMNACGVKRMTVDISTDTLAERGFTKKLCSPQCYNNCPIIIDIYFNLAAGEGIYLPRLCEAHRSGDRRMMSEVLSESKSSITAESFAAAPAATVGFGDLTISPASSPSPASS